MDYTNQNRGTFQNANRARQLIRFDELRFKNITPTDIDVFAEYHNEAFMFAELKHRNAKMPYGQELALTRIVDRIQASGAQSVLFLCEHNIHNPEEDVMAAESVVRSVYFNKKWKNGDGRNLKQYTEAFFQYATGSKQRK